MQPRFNVKRFVAGAFAAILLSAIAGLAYLGLGLMDVAADEKPGAWDSAVMTSAVHASVRRSAQGLKNPLPDSDATLVAGGKLFMNDCLGCHGAPGQPPSQFGLLFFPPAPQFPGSGSQYKDTELFWVAKHGIRMTGMDPQVPPYSDAQLWSLAAFISRIRALPPAVAKAIQPPPDTH